METVVKEGKEGRQVRRHLKSLVILFLCLWLLKRAAFTQLQCFQRGKISAVSSMYLGN